MIMKIATPLNEVQTKLNELYDLGLGRSGGTARTRVQELLHDGSKALNVLAYREITDHPLCPFGNGNYVVNGKPALKLEMKSRGGKANKDSGINNDANRYAIETMGDPRYPFDLFCRVITVSLETMKIVRGLPKLDI